MRAWLVQSKPGDDCRGLQAALRSWCERAANLHCHVETRELSPDPTATIRELSIDLVLFSPDVAISPAQLEEVFLEDVAGVVVVAESESKTYAALAERHPLLLLTNAPSADHLGTALINALSARNRHRHWKEQVQQLHQRLNDRIVIERAKGVLVQRLGIGEEEAYKRLRILSRRQRRQIRDIAQSLLDAQALLQPDANGHPTAERGLLADLQRSSGDAKPGLP